MSQKTVLYVEDNEFNRKIVRQLLGSTTYRLLEATDGEEAVATAIETHPDVILMDVQLPNLSGLRRHAPAPWRNPARGGEGCCGCRLRSTGTRGASEGRRSFVPFRDDTPAGRDHSENGLYVAYTLHAHAALFGFRLNMDRRRPCDLRRRAKRSGPRLSRPWNGRASEGPGRSAARDSDSSFSVGPSAMGERGRPEKLFVHLVWDGRSIWWLAAASLSSVWEGAQATQEGGGAAQRERAPAAPLSGGRAARVHGRRVHATSAITSNGITSG